MLETPFGFFRGINQMKGNYHNKSIKCEEIINFVMGSLTRQGDPASLVLLFLFLPFIYHSICNVPQTEDCINVSVKL
jgi:hypothetical protein